MKHTLVIPNAEEQIKRMEFLGNSPYLLVTTENTVTVWNLIYMNIWWSFGMLVLGVAVIPGTKQFAIFTRQKRSNKFKYSNAPIDPIYKSVVISLFDAEQA